jgi:hypothetical protein
VAALPCRLGPDASTELRRFTAAELDIIETFLRRALGNHRHADRLRSRARRATGAGSEG